MRDRCVEPVGLGEPCDDDSECLDGSCQDDVCAPLQVDGARCDRDAECRGFCRDYVCAPRVGEAERCRPGACAAGLGCVVELNCRALGCSHAAQVGTCRPLGINSGECAGDYKCQGAARCVDNGRGYSCTTSSRCGGLDDCAPGEVCNYATRTCRARGRDGDPCAYRYDCAPGFACKGDQCRVP